MPVRDAVRVLRAVLDTVVPHRCLACGARGTTPWCVVCARAAARLQVSRSCRRCGAGGSGPHGCWPDRSPLQETVVAYRYRGVVASTVVAAKVRGASAAWTPLGRRLAAIVGDTAMTADVVTWVPAERRRLRERGFDHAAALAGPIAVRLGRPTVALLESRPGRPDQATRPVHERRGVPLSAFRATATLVGAIVLLVDDVVTTGATAWSAAAALRRGGADGVLLAALARAGEHELGPADGTAPRIPGRC